MVGKASVWANLPQSPFAKGDIGGFGLPWFNNLIRGLFWPRTPGIQSPDIQPKSGKSSRIGESPERIADALPQNRQLIPVASIADNAKK